MIIYNGRPDSTDGRQDREIRVYNFLDELGIEYVSADHAETSAMSDCREVGIEMDMLICKNLFLCNRQKTSFYLLMMPADKPFKTKELSAQLGIARLSFADPKDMLELLDVKPGAVSIMGLMNDKERRVTLLVDREVLNTEYTGCHPCVCTSSLKIRTKELFGRIIDALKHDYIIVDLTGAV